MTHIESDPLLNVNVWTMPCLVREFIRLDLERLGDFFGFEDRTIRLAKRLNPGALGRGYPRGFQTCDRIRQVLLQPVMPVAGVLRLKRREFGFWMQMRGLDVNLCMS